MSARLKTALIGGALFALMVAGTAEWNLPLTGWGW